MLGVSLHHHVHDGDGDGGGDMVIVIVDPESLIKSIIPPKYLLWNAIFISSHLHTNV